ncbi:MAG TPA: response regulator transcription factor [Bacteroidales bacterium]|nr:response regulator transcription factor [Bacteroidales bacterium]
MASIRVILADDHALFRNGLKLLLSGQSNIEVVGEASDGIELLKVIEEIRADVVLLDIEMPMMNGIDAAYKALQIDPQLKIISLSMYSEEEYYYKMIEAGVKGFILKNSDISEVVEAIETVYKGNTYFSSDVLYNVVKNIKTVGLKAEKAANISDRESEVLEQICKGLSNQEIADNLFISRRTVEKHRASLLLKTNTKNTAQLIMYAIENKLLE